jgi:asparagine N-glycosylation enzyme membrane subunit Stt3
MSENMPIGLFLFEKLFGLILLIIGAIVAYYSINLSSGDVAHLSGLFTLIGIVILGIGIFLLVTKTEK